MSRCAPIAEKVTTDPSGTERMMARMSALIRAKASERGMALQRIATSSTTVNGGRSFAGS
jgi:hypothetical protein